MDDCGNSMHATLVTLKFGVGAGVGLGMLSFREPCLGDLKPGTLDHFGWNISIGLGVIDGQLAIKSIDITVETSSHLGIHHKDVSRPCPCNRPPLPPSHPTLFNAVAICGACYDACSKSCNLSDSDPDGGFPECMDRCTLGDLSVFEEFDCPGWKRYINP